MKFPIRFYCALGVSAALLAFLPRFVSFLPKFRNVQWNGGITLLNNFHENLLIFKKVVEV